ncbi:hypothetical protein ACLM45_13640 [Synechococcus sp. A10-1-5-9]|uniref:hypothetical protein n=1 Tax=Synechococcus sp. A10-1-5-9 TaxID=3392295 RepID=UPI0039E84EEB
MTSAKSADGRILFPWVMRDVEHFWNKWFSQKFNFRSYTHGKSNSASKAAYRFSRILRDSAVWLDGSGKTDIDVLLASWEAKMLAVSVYMEQNGTDEAEGVMNRPVNATLNFWQFHAGCRHIHHLSCLQLGIDPDGALAADQQRRQDKAQILKDFDKEMKAFVKSAAYLSGSGKGSNDRLEQALAIARQALAQAEDDLRWEAK